MNEHFLKRMKNMLQEEYPEYLQSLQQPFHRGLRVNTLKCTVEELKERVDFKLKPTQISNTVFEIDSELKALGNSLEHRSGLYYLQEISACSAVEILDPHPGEWVLDLCAAPGGKTTQIAMKMQNKGILFTNEVDHARAQILLSNCERCGVSNAVITNSSVDMLKKHYVGCMDRILVDAPCSGEGMFKKESQALADWSEEHVQSCSVRQKKILDDAIMMLKENGILVYSTCTYSIEENEAVIDYLLTHYPWLELVDCGVSFGRNGFNYGLVDGKKVRRIFPMDQGEGHFVAKLRKNKDTGSLKLKTIKSVKEPVIAQFLEQQLLGLHDYKTTVLNEKIYLSQLDCFDLKGIKVLRQGILLGELKKGRIEPHQHFYVSSLLQNQFKHWIECSYEEAIKVLKGETLTKPGLRGYYALCYKNKNFGFTKVDGMNAKNHYPKGLRIR